MEVFKKYRNSIWRVPLISLAAGIFYHPIYIRAVLQFCVTEPGVIDRRGALMIDAAILAVVLIAGKMTLLRRQSKKEILISAGVVSAYGILLLLVQLLTNGTTGAAAILFMYLDIPLRWTNLFTNLSFYLQDYFQISVPVIRWMRFFVPFLFVLLDLPKNKKAVSS